ncbi:hypothetical protein RUND412_010264 [Rhizina undulata]
MTNVFQKSKFKPAMQLPQDRSSPERSPFERPPPEQSLLSEIVREQSPSAPEEQEHMAMRESMSDLLDLDSGDHEGRWT